MERWPVRFHAAAVALSALVLFSAVLGWGHAERARAASGRDKLLVSREALIPAPADLEPRWTPALPGAAHVVQLEAPGPAARPSRTTAFHRHRVQQGDTFWEIARRYGAGVEDVLLLNQLVDPGHLQVGQEILVPARPASAGVQQPTAESDLNLGNLFKWPIVAPVSSPFGPRSGRNHAGVDLAANSGDSILAARDGNVILAGPVTGYGLTVIVRHPDGTRTLYAHCSKLLVQAGKQVRQGERIALVGSTGISTGPHLHFEIIVNDRPRDPMLYLPVFGSR